MKTDNSVLTDASFEAMTISIQIEHRPTAKKLAHRWKATGTFRGDYFRTPRQQCWDSVNITCGVSDSLDNSLADLRKKVADKRATLRRKINA